MFYLIFLIICGFIIGLSYPTGLEPLYFQPIVTLIACLVLTAIYVMAGFWLVRHYLKKLTSVHRPTEIDFHSIMRSYLRNARRYRIALLIVYAIQIFVFHLPLIITHSLGLKDIIFLTNFLILLPFFITYLLSLLPSHKMDCYLRQSKWSLGKYFIFQVRSYLLIAVAPLFVLIFYTDLIYHIDALYELVFIYPLSGWLMVSGLMFVMFLITPFFLRGIWGLKVLPEGNLKKRLFNLATKAGVKVKNILVWSIGRGRMANAMVVGLIPQWRYVVFTDTLLAHLNEEEVETVFGHEVGHAKQHHLLFYLIFSVGYICLVVVFEEVLKIILGKDNPLVVVNLFIFMAAYWGVLFGLISRRLEHQADLFGALITNNFNGFISALRKISSLNASSPSQRSIQHPSVERRIRFLVASQESPVFIKQFTHSMKGIIRLLIVILVLGGVGCIWVSYKQMGEAPDLKKQLVQARMIHEMAEEGLHLMKEEKYNEAIEVFKKVTAFQPTNSLYYIWLGDALGGKSGGLSEEALEAYQKARLLNPKDPFQRMYLHDKLKEVQDAK